MKPIYTEILQDSRLLSVRLMLDPIESCRIFQQGLPMFYQNGNQLISCKPTIKKYKFGKRAVIQYHWKIRDGEFGITVLGKIYNSDRGSKIVRRMEILHNHLKEKNVPIIIPKIYGYLPHVRLLVQEYIAGQPIRTYIQSSAGYEQIKQIARLLATLHEINIEFPHKRTAQEELEQLNSFIHTLPDTLSPLKNELLHKYQKLETEHRKPKTEIYCLIHRDFHHDQVLFDNQRAILTDLDELCLGEDALDIGNFLAHLRLLSLEIFHQSNRLEEYRKAFISEYQNCRTQPVDFERIHFYETATYLRLACILVNSNKPMDWITEMVNLGSLE